jgi:hypothetical protein
MDTMPASARHECACFFIPSYIFEAFATEPDVDERTREVASNALRVAADIKAGNVVS